LPSQRRNTSVNLGLSSLPEKVRLQYGISLPQLLCFEKNPPRWLNKGGINCIINERVSWVIEQNRLFRKEKANTQISEKCSCWTSLCALQNVRYAIYLLKRLESTLCVNLKKSFKFCTPENKLAFNPIIHFCLFLQYYYLHISSVGCAKLLSLYIWFFFTSTTEINTKLKLWSLPSVGNEKPLKILQIFAPERQNYWAHLCAILLLGYLFCGSVKPEFLYPFDDFCWLPPN